MCDRWGSRGGTASEGGDVWFAFVARAGADETLVQQCSGTCWPTISCRDIFMLADNFMSTSIVEGMRCGLWRRQCDDEHAACAAVRALPMPRPRSTHHQKSTRLLLGSGGGLGS